MKNVTPGVQEAAAAAMWLSQHGYRVIEFFFPSGTEFVVVSPQGELHPGEPSQNRKLALCSAFAAALRAAQQTELAAACELVAA